MLRLWCFPYAGGGVGIFRRWSEGLPGNVEVHPVELPGRGRQFTEPAARRMDVLVDTLAETIGPHLDKPFAFFGHSMGALVSFELAHAVRARYQVEPTTLYLAAQPAPHLPKKQAPLHQLSDAELRTELRRIGGTPQEVLTNEDFMALLLPTLRADFEVCETYTYRPAEPLTCPIVTFGGKDDPQATEPELQAWAELTAGSFTLEMLPGDHFFIDHNRQDLLAAVSASLDLAER